MVSGILFLTYRTGCTIFFHACKKYKYSAGMAELVDARDLKSLGAWLCTGSIPVPGTIKNNHLAKYR